MISPKDKAEELVHTYRVLLMDDGEDYGEEILVSMLSKQCALIAVGEILLQNNVWIKQIGKGTNNYWNEVKQEIAKL